MTLQGLPGPPRKELAWSHSAGLRPQSDVTSSMILGSSPFLYGFQFPHLQKVMNMMRWETCLEQGLVPRSQQA
jgi:hypothetical protein